MVDGPVVLDGIAVGLDDERAVADAGIVLRRRLAKRLGIEALVGEHVNFGDRAGPANSGGRGSGLPLSTALGRKRELKNSGVSVKTVRPPVCEVVATGSWWLAGESVSKRILRPARAAVQARRPTWSGHPDYARTRTQQRRYA
jgi:hypothetical protein